MLLILWFLWFNSLQKCTFPENGTYPGWRELGFCAWEWALFPNRGGGSCLFVDSACCRIQNSKNWGFLVHLQDLDFCSVQNFFSFRSWSRFQTHFDSWSVCEVVNEAILHMQQELRNEADRILKFGSCGGTWRRIEVFCYPTPWFYGIHKPV